MLRDTGNDGPFWTGRGWAFSVIRSWDDDPPQPFWLVEYDPRGVLLDERRLPVEWVEGWAAVLAVGPDRSFWLEVACGSGITREEPLCDQLAHVDAGGVVRARWRRPVEGFRTGAEPWSFVRGEVTESQLAVQELDPTTSGALLPPRVVTLPPDIGPARMGRGLQRPGRNAPLWTLGPDGSVALVQSDGDAVRVAVLAADGELRYDRRVPQAAPHLLRAEGDTTFRLGAPHLAELAPDGSLVLTAWRLHPDCSRDREPGFVVLDPSGRLRSDVKTEVHPEGLAIAPDGEVALLAGMHGLVFDLDGNELARFETRPASWAYEERRLARRAETIGPGDDPAEWIAVYSAASKETRVQLDAWLVAAWPRSEPHLRDAHWRRLGTRLCAAHEAAPPTALRRYEASRGDAKAAWLGTLVECFREPPPGALEYATTLAERRDGRHQQLAQRAFDAWGTPFERLQAEVEDMLARPYWDAGREVALRLSLLAPLLEDALRAQIVARRVAARGRLVGWLGRPEELFAPEQRPTLEASRRLLAARAERWARDGDAFVATTGRLALLATGARPASELLPGLLADATRDADLAGHLPGALAVGASDAELDGLGDDLLAATFALAVDGPASAGSEGYWPGGSRNAEHRLVDRLGARGRELLWQRAMTVGAGHEARRRLLESLASDPVGWGEDRLRLVLDTEWSTRWTPADRSQVHAGFATIQFLHSVFASAVDHANALPAEQQAGRTLANDQPATQPLEDLVARRFRELFVGAASSLPASRRSESLAGLFTFAARTPSLLASLDPEDARQLLEESGHPLSAWLWLVAETGGWPAIEGQLVELLADSRHALAAARALAPLRHPAALDVLLERGLTNHRRPPVEAFAAFGGAARERLLPFLEHRDRHVRGSVTRILRALDPPKALVDELAAEAAAAFERGELPDVEVVLLLAEAGRDIFPALLTAAASPEFHPHGLGSQLANSLYYRHSGEISRELGRWVLRSGDDGQRAQALAFLRELGAHDPSQLAWTRRLEASLRSTPTP